MRARQASLPEPLKGKRFLIVEDEPLIALDIVAGLEGVGMNVEGPIGSVKDALRAVEEGSFDGGLLDANLRGEPVDEVAAALIRHNFPFAFVMGYGRQALPESFARATVLTKPFTQEQLLRTVSQLGGSDRICSMIEIGAVDRAWSALGGPVFTSSLAGRGSQ